MYFCSKKGCKNSFTIKLSPQATMNTYWFDSLVTKNLQNFVTDYWQVLDRYAKIGAVILKNQPFLGGIYEI